MQLYFVSVFPQEMDKRFESGISNITTVEPHERQTCRSRRLTRIPLFQLLTLVRANDTIHISTEPSIVKFLCNVKKCMCMRIPVSQILAFACCIRF